MALNNWSYDEVNDLLDNLINQKIKLIDMLENLVTCANSMDERLSEYVGNALQFDNFKVQMETAIENIDSYCNWLKELNETAKTINDENYDSLNDIEPPVAQTTPPEMRTPIYTNDKVVPYQEIISSGSSSYSSSGTNSTEGETNTLTTEVRKKSGGGVSMGSVAVGAGIIGTGLSEFLTESPTERPIESETVVQTETPTEIETEPKKEEDSIINGATGFSALNNKQYLHVEPNKSSASICPIPWAEPFRIISSNKNDTWWKVQYNGQTGYLENKYCLINLPDYIPSIQYNITNASACIYKSSGQPLSVYGQQLYTSGKVYNERLGRNEYIVPLSYVFAKKILAIQTAAMAMGYCLKIYDAYRPKSVAINVRDSLQALYKSSSTVKKNIDISPVNGSIWGTSWFIASNISAHSLASAIDVTMVNNATGCEIASPSAMHELSTQAVKYIHGTKGQTTVRENLYVPELGEECKLMDKIMVTNGLTNLASEWWHFQDNVAYHTIAGWEPAGLDFQPTRIVSTKSSI